MQTRTTSRPQPFEALDVGQRVSLTLYNQGPALIRDRRACALQVGLNVVDFPGVPTRIEPRSITFCALSDPHGTRVLEQSYLHDTSSWEVLLRRYVGETLELTTEDGTRFVGQLVSSRTNPASSERPTSWDANDLILRQSDGQLVAVRLGRIRDIRFPAPPANLVTRPTLRWVVTSALSGEQQLEALYLTEGLTWTADYNILLAPDKESLDLSGWVTLTNTSGAGFRDAQVRLAYTEVKRATSEEHPSPFRHFAALVRGSEPSDPPEPRAPAPASSDTYDLDDRISLDNQQARQINLVNLTAIPAKSTFVYDAGAPFEKYPQHPIKRQSDAVTSAADVQKWLEFGIDPLLKLPPGQVRIYYDSGSAFYDAPVDAPPAATLLGESRLNRSRGKVRIGLGKAADLSGQRTQTHFHPIGQMLLEETFEIRLCNRQETESVNIHLVERLFRWHDWEILSASHEYVQTDEATIEFDVKVPPTGETVVTYIVRYIWPA
jgi:hypothetical protein